MSFKANIYIDMYIAKFLTYHLLECIVFSKKIKLKTNLIDIYADVACAENKYCYLNIV